MSMKSGAPLRVALLNISQHNRSLLEFFIQGGGKDYYQLADIPQAQILILDFDQEGAEAAWSKFGLDQKRPSIVFSEKSVELERVIWLAKPLSSQAMIDAGKKARDFFDDDGNVWGGLKSEDDTASDAEISSQGEVSGQASAQDQDASVSDQVSTQNEQPQDHSIADRTAYEAGVGEGLAASAVQPVFKTNTLTPVPPAPNSQDSNVSPESGTALDPGVNATEGAAMNQLTAEHQQTIAEKVARAIESPQIADAPAAPTNEGAIRGAQSQTDTGEKSGPVSANLSAKPAEQTKPRFAKKRLSPQEQKQVLARWQLLCGQMTDADDLNAVMAMSDYNAEDNYLVNQIKKALVIAQQSETSIQLALPRDNFLLFDAHRQKVFSTLNIQTADFASLASTAMGQSEISIEYPGISEAESLRTNLKEKNGHALNFESLQWTAGLLAAKGRLSRDTNLSRPLYLKHWPNFTRIESVPHMLPIAGLWSKRSATIKEVAEVLSIPQRYVISFYAGAQALGLMGVDDGNAFADKKNVDVEKRGFISRILKRLQQRLKR